MQGAKELYLGVVGEIAHLVEEERAACGRLESALLVGDSAREGALDMAEELRCRELARYGAAVYGDEWFAAACAALVKQMRHMLLAGAAGAAHENRHVGRRHERYILVEARRGFAAAFDIARLRRSGGRRCFGRTVVVGLGCILRAVAACGRSLAYLFEQHVGADRFGNVVGGAQLHAKYGVVYVGISGHDYDRQRPVLTAEPLQQIGAVLVGQTHVGQNQRYVFVPRKRLHGACGVRGRERLETALREQRFQHHRQRYVVVDYQYLVHRRCLLSGSGNGFLAA